MARLLVDSAEAAKLIPFARGKLRAFRVAGITNITQRYEVNGFVVRVTLNGNDETIEVRGGQAGYEFWVNDDFRVYPTGLGSAGHVNVIPTDSDGVEVPGEMTSDFAQGHAVHLTAKGKATARYSTNLAPNAELGQSWPVVSPRRLTTVTPSNGTKAEPGWFYTKWSWQDQKMFEHSWWRGNKGDWLMTSALGFNYGLSNCAPQLGAGTTAYAYRSQFFLKLSAETQTGGDRGNDPATIDAGFDIKTCAYSARGVQVGASRQQGSKVWYRRAAVQTVTMPSGRTRDYVIHSDTHGRFTVWPLGEYQNTAKYPELYADNPISYADLPPSIARVFVPPYPAWVTVPDTSQDVGAEHWMWQFNKTATKCVAIPHKKIEAWVWVWVKTNPGNPFGPYWLVDGKPLMPNAHYNNLYATRSVGDYESSAPGRDDSGGFVPEADGDTWEYMRVREYRVKRGGAFSSVPRAYLVNGTLVGCSHETGKNDIINGDVRDWKAVKDADVFEPAFTYLPGLLEFGITVTSTNENDPYDFGVSFEVLQDKFYDETSVPAKRYYVDAAYYIATPRTRAQDAADGLKDDDLLVAEVEVFFTPGPAVTDDGPGFNPTVPGGDIDPLRSNSWKYLTAGVQYAQGGRRLEGVAGKRRFHEHIDEPYLESSITGQFRAAGVFSYYTVRKHQTQAQIQRLCLVHNEWWEWGFLSAIEEHLFAGPDVRGRNFIQADDQTVPYAGRIFMPTTTQFENSLDFETGLARAKYVSENCMPTKFVTHIDVADLRFLNFVTRTYQRKKATPSTYERVYEFNPVAGVTVLRWNTTPVEHKYIFHVYPNHHLRIRGDAVRSILYEPDIPELGPDPAATKITPGDGVVRMPSIPRGGSPCGNEGVTLAMQQEFAARFITPNQLPGSSIPAHPDGHWAACINRTQGEIFFEPPEGIPVPTGDLIAPLAASTEDGRAWFDTIHVHGKKDTTHKAAFNKAFGQNRDYSYYADPDGLDDGEEYGGFMAGALWVMN